MSAPQRDLYGPGATGAASFDVSFADVVSVSARIGYLALTRGLTSPLALGGSSLDLGLGARLHTPFATSNWVPFIGAFGQYVLTGALSRPGLRAEVGALFPIASRGAWLGPVFAYQHVFAGPTEPTFSTRDASLLVLGVALQFPLGARAADRDADGVLDSLDRCPDTAAPGRPDGCPAADVDGDGVMDGDDACPAVPGPASRGGCPDDDPDKDGVRGTADQCPAQAEDRDGFRDDDGCPEADNDGDGLLDADDECPLEAGARATRGCPDGDGDGVQDRVDQCPKVAGLPETGGCPKYKAIVVTETKIELSQKIFFAFGLTTILPRSYPLLDEVVQALNDRRELCVRIEGHTDSVGSVDRNMALSQGRAQAVKDYLAGHGVPARNLEAKGYGPTLPLDSNASDAGRERNRRVEFVITRCP